MNIPDSAVLWLAGSDKGISSEAIWHHMTGINGAPGHFRYSNWPHDPADLGRCLRLLEAVPEWKPRIPEMSKYGKGWAALVPAWDVLENCMLNEVGINWEKGRSAPATYDLMKKTLGNY